MPSRLPIIIQWQWSSYFGWGTYGVNLALEWANDEDLLPLTSSAFERKAIVLDGLRWQRMEPLLAASQRLQDHLRPYAGGSVAVSMPVLAAIGNGLGAPKATHDIALQGNPNIAVVVFESTHLPPESCAVARSFPLIITGSRWNEEILRAAGLEHVTTVWQGVDPTLFHPAERSGWFQDRFVIFSGGKLEYRKGQDIVIRAFRAFSQRHPESLLVTAWQSPWPDLARTFDGCGSVAPVPLTKDARVDVQGWAVLNGLRAEQVIDIDAVANPLLPTVLREMDVALFPNRAEGGTNLLAMEAMACGVPCILSRNTGHRDIMSAPDAADPHCYPLERQTPIGYLGTEGWGESDVEEAVEALEAVWRNRDEAAARGARGAARIAALSWSAQARRLKETIMPLLRS